MTQSSGAAVLSLRGGELDGGAEAPRHSAGGVPPPRNGLEVRLWLTHPGSWPSGEGGRRGGGGECLSVPYKFPFKIFFFLQPDLAWLKPETILAFLEKSLQPSAGGGMEGGQALGGGGESPAPRHFRPISALPAF